MKEKQENYFIDFLRFVFSVCIVFYHSWMFAGEFGKGIFNYGYLAVDFYFIVTGYLMINSMSKSLQN
jgi:peptidoglycan/LPS O-acetylase OafA/YrhL